MKSDMWAIGVIAYILICREPPFKFGADNQKVSKSTMEEFLNLYKNFENFEVY